LKILVAGNPLVRGDRLALEVAERLGEKLRGIEFEEIGSLDGIQENSGLYIMDVALGLKKVELVEDLRKLQTKQPVSGHDFDLAMELKLLHKLGKVGKVKIIAIPANYPIKKAAEEAEALLKKINA